MKQEIKCSRIVDFIRILYTVVQSVAYKAHILVVGGSSPSPATNFFSIFT